MTFRDVIRRLERGFAATLPGPEAQARLAPVPRRRWPPGHNPARVRNAAGLLLVFPKRLNAEHAEHAESQDSQRVRRALRSTSSEAAHIVLTVRADSLRHGGQVSLPGGAVDPGETFEQAALREAREEIALDTARVEIVGALTPIDVHVSGFRLHPIVGTLDGKPRLTPADGEVARILELPIADLLDPASVMHTRRERDGILYTVPGFHVAGVEIWGATAMVLAEFLALLGWNDKTPE